MYSTKKDYNSYFKRIKKIDYFTRIFRDEPRLGMLNHNSHILLNLQYTIQKCDAHGDTIDQILQDKVLTQQEYSILIENIIKVDEITRNIEQRDESNRFLVNEIIQLVKYLDMCIKKVTYALGYSRAAKMATDLGYGYVLMEDAFQLSLLLLGDFVMKAETDEGQEKTQHKMKSDIERILIKLARWAGMAEKYLVPNVLYHQKPIFFEELINLKDALHYVLSPYIHLIKNGYYRQILQSAKMGLEELSSYEEFLSGEDIRIKGLFRAKKGVTELELLKNSIITD